MSMTDPIADMLTRMRNALAQRMPSAIMPSSKVKLGIAEVLKREGFITDFEILENDKQNDLKITFKYGPEGEYVIQNIKRFSTPGCRRYRSVQELPVVLNGLGIAIVSTNQGVLSDRECRERNVGGEVFCTIY